MINKGAMIIMKEIHENSKQLNRNIVYVSRSAYGTTNVINYDASNYALNDFLRQFDVWGGNGNYKICSDGKHSKVCFECSKEFYNFASTEDFIRIFRRFEVIVIFDDDSRILDID